MNISKQNLSNICQFIIQIHTYIRVCIYIVVDILGQLATIGPKVPGPIESLADV